MRIQYAVLRVPQYMPVRPSWGGFKGPATRLIEEPSHPVSCSDGRSQRMPVRPAASRYARGVSARTFPVLRRSQPRGTVLRTRQPRFPVVAVEFRYHGLNRDVEREQALQQRAGS
jgi:hypothetical protein